MGCTRIGRIKGNRYFMGERIPFLIKIADCNIVSETLILWQLRLLVKKRHLVMMAVSVSKEEFI